MRWGSGSTRKRGDDRRTRGAVRARCWVEGPIVATGRWRPPPIRRWANLLLATAILSGLMALAAGSASGDLTAAWDGSLVVRGRRGETATVAERSARSALAS